MKTERLEELVNQFASGSLSRRQFVTYLAAFAAAGAASVRSDSTYAAQRQSVPTGESLLTEEDRRPFAEIARRKGHEVRAGTFDSQSKIPSDQIHLDMDMVDESIRSAIKQTQRTGQTLVHDKLERLLQNGTDAQKVEFVLGSGTYYFPEDIENLARLSRASGGQALQVNCRRVCEVVWYYICRCTGTVQQCRDEARELCHIICD